MTIRQKLAQWFYSPGAYGLWVALDDAENWSFDGDDETAYYRATWASRHGLTYVDTCVAQMWVGGGPFFFDGRGSNTPKFLGVLERHLLWWKFRKMRWLKRRYKETENNRSMLYRFTRLEDPK